MNVARVVLCLLTVVCAAGRASAEPLPAIHLTSGLTSLALDSQTEVLRDDSGAWTLEQVKGHQLFAQFQSTGGKAINYGYSTAARWYRFTLVNDAAVGGNEDWVFEIAYPPLDHIDIHVIGKGGPLAPVLTGDQRPISPTQLNYRNFAIPLSVPAGEAVTLYMRVQTAGSHQVPMHLWSAREFMEESQLESMGLGLFFGVLAVMAFYNFFIFLGIREAPYFWYIATLVTFALLQVNLDGIMYQYAAPRFAFTPRLVNQGMPVLICLPLISGLLFSRTLLRTPQTTPRSNLAINVVIAVLCALIILSPVLPYSKIVPACAAMGGVVITTFVVAGINGIRAKVPAAHLYFASWIFLVIGILIKLLELFGVLPTSFLTAYSWQIGALLLATLLSIALADRINQERKVRNIALDSARRLKDFLPQKVAELVSQGNNPELLAPKRRQVTVCVIDLRGFTPFSETAAPEDVMNVLRDFFDAMGHIVEKHDGTVEHFAGDSMLIFFNAPIEIPFPEEQAVLNAIEMREAFGALRERWARLGHDLGLGIGIADGYATIGAIGFAGRSQYAAIGSVTNLAARLCSLAKHGEILVTRRVRSAVEKRVNFEPAGEHIVKGFARAIELARVVSSKQPSEPGATLGS